ncbi:MAG: M23 family metallopeptidase [Firmicutes bacterium]|nr:M23 family metallopeptidase [Bacillota bacterium]
MEKKYTGGRAARFFKKNLYYMIIIVATLAIGLAVVLSLTLGRKPALPADSIPSDLVNTKPAEMLAPVDAAFTVAKLFADDRLIWSETLRLFETHQGIDIQAPAGTAVVAALDGTVVRVANVPLEGYVVEIRHSDSLKTVYKSLGSDILVTEGQTVARGARIGSVADTMTYEIAEGPHLHFEVVEAGALKDPGLYIAAYK